MLPSSLQSTYQRAIKYAGEKHHAQTVPGSPANYVVHLSNVAMEVLVAWQQQPDFDIELAVQLALLHDVLEDTDTDPTELEALFGTAVAQGVAALTKDEQLPDKQAKMADSLARIRQQAREVGIVKLADRITNLQAPPAYWSVYKRRLYLQEAQGIAEALADRHAYLYRRLIEKIEEYGKYLGEE